MKKLRLVLALLSVCVMLPFSLSADTIGYARISLTEGDVLYQTMDSGTEWAYASINMPLMSGDRIRVPEAGRTEIQFNGGSYIRTDRNTGLDIIRLSRDGEGNITKLALTQGRAYVYCNRSSGINSAFQVDTPLISVIADKSAIFDVYVYEEGYTEVNVIKGTVFIEGHYINTRVNAGDMISVSAESRAKLSAGRQHDGWISWNISRDSVIAGTGPSIKYLPSSLYDYGSDFDRHGRWVYTEDYGHVWSPRMTVAAWAPYSHGRWVWRNHDYVWVSYEPWGWVPYHYGRWGFRVGIGWFWVPPAVNDVFWGPGFVAWINTPTYVSWVPLAPGEIYYGHGHYGRHSVNLTRVNIKNISITNVYINARAANAVRVVHHDNFVKGKHVKHNNTPANPFLSGPRGSAGRPSVKQVNLSPLPLKVVEKKHLPPKREVDSKRTTGLSGRSTTSSKANSAPKLKAPVSSLHTNVIRDQKSAPLKQEHRAETRTAITNRNRLKQQDPGKTHPSKITVRRVDKKPEPQITKQAIRQGTGMAPPTSSTFSRNRTGSVPQVGKKATQTEVKNLIAQNNLQTRGQETKLASPEKKPGKHEIRKEKKS
jgi:hypothetical protein